MAAGLVLAAGAAGATTVPFEPVTGFDTSGLSLPVDFTMQVSDWVDAGQIPAGLPVEIQETQCLKTSPSGPCSATLPPGVGPYSSEVTWTLTNNSGRSGPALLFFSGIQDFDPSVSPSYDHADVGIVLESADFKLVQMDVLGTTYSYLAFLVDDFGTPLTFTYEVNAQQLAGGTPQMLVNATFDFVPEPSTGLLLGIGLLGLARAGRTRRAA